MNYLKQHGAALIGQGYSIVPIAKGEKFPKGLKGWQNEPATLDNLGKWLKMDFKGVGIQARHCVGVDLDIYDEEVCKKMKDFVIDILGPSLVRVGLPPKILLPYRTITSFQKVQSQRFISPDWHIHKVEMLGEGQQWVAYHDHPDTGKPYTWYWNDKPCEGIVKVRFDTLPTITEIQSKKIVTGFNTLMAGVGWKIFVENEVIAEAVRQGYEKDKVMKALRNGTLHELKHKNVLETVLGGDDWLDSPAPGVFSIPSNGGDPIIAPRSNGGDPCNDSSGPHDGDSFAYLKPKLNIGWEEMVDALKEIASDDYEIWIRVGMALWHQTDGSPKGQSLWDQWSSTASNYSPDLVDEKWSGFSDAGSRDPVTFATVLKMARESKKRNQKKPSSLLIDYVDMGDLEPPKYLIEKYIEEDTTGAIFGDPGSYKSFFALDMSLCVATGTNWQGCRVKQGPVIYIAGEGRAGIKKRVAVWKKSANMKVERGQIFFSELSISLYDQENAEQLENCIEKIIKPFGKPSLIVIDTLARSFSPGDENSTADMGKFIDHINKYLREPLGCVVLMVHHSGHTHKQRPRGAKALTAGIDFEYRIEKPKDLVTKMICTKMKDAEEPPETWFRGEEVVLGIFNDKEVKSLIFEKTEAPDKEEKPIEGNQKKLYDLLCSMKNSEGSVNRKELNKMAIENKIAKNLDQVRDCLRKLKDKGLIEANRTEVWVLDNS